MISPFVTQGSWRGPLRAEARRSSGSPPGSGRARTRACLPGQISSKSRAVEDLEAERDAVDAHLAQRVVAPQVAVGRRLHADQQAQLAS